MSLVLAGLLVAGASGAALIGRWLSGRKKEEPVVPKADDAAVNKTPAPGPTLEGFPCQLGDVVMRMTGEEAWLAGGVVLEEEVPITVLFVAPDAGHDRALYVHPSPRASIVWLDPLDPSAILVGGEPPSSVEFENVRFERVRRLPLRPRRIGTGAPDLGDSVVVAEYASAGDDRLVVFKSGGLARAYRGVELGAGAYEVIPSGRNTLE